MNRWRMVIMLATEVEQKLEDGMSERRGRGDDDCGGDRGCGSGYDCKS
jgi:hypothetical protein